MRNITLILLLLMSFSCSTKKDLPCTIQIHNDVVYYGASKKASQGKQLVEPDNVIYLPVEFKTLEIGSINSIVQNIRVLDENKIIDTYQSNVIRTKKLLPGKTYTVLIETADGYIYIRKLKYGK